MTARLSKLQKRILVLALANHRQEGRDKPYTPDIKTVVLLGTAGLKPGTERGGADLYYSQIMAEVYGFPLQMLWGWQYYLAGVKMSWEEIEGKAVKDDPRLESRWEEAGRETLRDKEGHRHPGGKLFDVEEIGRERYNAACAAISRAMVRLEARGLVKRIYGRISHWSGCDLTPEGVKAAEVETVKSRSKLNST
jgi:hypothetical protein